MEIITRLRNRVHKQFLAPISVHEIMCEGIGETNGYLPEKNIVQLFMISSEGGQTNSPVKICKLANL